ncbi:hypothetical protein GCM10027589_33230 [Actinocorallia lasiicapitis]
MTARTLPKLALGTLLAAGIGIPAVLYGTGSSRPEPKPSPSTTETENPVITEQLKWWEQHGNPLNDGSADAVATEELEPEEPITDLTLAAFAPPDEGQVRIAAIEPTPDDLSTITAPARVGGLEVQLDCLGKGKITWRLEALHTGTWKCKDGETNPVTTSLHPGALTNGPLTLRVHPDPGVSWTMSILNCPRKAPCAWP